MPPPTEAHTRLKAPFSSAPLSTVDRLTIPLVNFPELPPGHPLPPTATDLEAATGVHFVDSISPPNKRGRPAFPEAMPGGTSTVLDVLEAEEQSRGMIKGTHKYESLGGRVTMGISSAPENAGTMRYLTQLFCDPARCEKDVYRLVDTAKCRRLLKQGEDRFKTDSTLPEGADPPGASGQKRVCDFVSCLTVGQHQRYRAFVVEWLQHSPSRFAPPDSGEVLLVVQQEMRLFLEVLRREATSCLALLSSNAGTTTYTLLGDALTSFAKFRRLYHMRHRLISFLDDAKDKSKDNLLVVASGPEGIDHSGAELSKTVPLDEDGDTGSHAVTPSQLFLRCFPSFRVLQWHMARIYNAQQSGIAATFPYPHVHASHLHFSTDSVRRCDSDVMVRADALRSTTPQWMTLLGKVVSPILPLDSLSALVPEEHAALTAEDNAGGAGSHSDLCEELQFSADSCVPALQRDGSPVAAGASMSTVELHNYVAPYLLPRMGWQVDKYQEKDGSACIDAGMGLVSSVSLSIAFRALLKLFVAHVDTEEPRTSFRIPIRVHLERKAPPPEHKNATAHVTGTTGGVYHAHLEVGAPIPNVKESRHSIQVAAAEHLLSRSVKMKESNNLSALSSEACANNAQHVSASAVASSSVHLSRSVAMQRVTLTDKKTKRLAAESEVAMPSMAELVVQNETDPNESVSSPPPLVFRVTKANAFTPCAVHEGVPQTAPSLEFLMAKMEHLNVTSAAAPHQCPVQFPATSSSDGGVTLLSDSVTATPCSWLLEIPSPRELLELDLLFACFPGARVHLHRVQLSRETIHDPKVETAAKENCDAEPRMRLLAVEELTCETWALYRRHLQERPLESFITSPSPAEVLATHSWDLLYDTLTWLMDTVSRRVAHALASEARNEEPIISDQDVRGRDSVGKRYGYFILSNHANLVNTSASTRVYAKRKTEGTLETKGEAATTTSYTESRFAVRFVVQDAAEIYPDHEPKVDVAYETEKLLFVEDDDSFDEESIAHADYAGLSNMKKRGASKIASRLYRDPHTWNRESIPFTFLRSVAAPSSHA